MSNEKITTLQKEKVKTTQGMRDTNKNAIDYKSELIELGKTVGITILSGCLRVIASTLNQASYDINEIRKH